MPKRDCPRFIVGYAPSETEAEEFLTVATKKSLGVIKTAPDSTDWRTAFGTINLEDFQNAIDWYYGVHVPHMKKHLM